MLKIKGVIVCDLLIICQREFRHEFRRDYARAIASAGLRDVDSHWLYEDENENENKASRTKQKMVGSEDSDKREYFLNEP